MSLSTSSSNLSSWMQREMTPYPGLKRGLGKLFLNYAEKYYLLLEKPHAYQTKPYRENRNKPIHENENSGKPLIISHL